MVVITITYPEELFKDKIDQAIQNIGKSLQRKKRAFDIWRTMTYDNIVSTVKNNPVETLTIVTSVGAVGTVTGSMYSLYENFQNQNSQKNIVIVNKTDSASNSTYLDLGKKLQKTKQTTIITIKDNEYTKPKVVENKKTNTIKAEKFEALGNDGLLFAISNNNLVFNSTSQPDIAKAVTSFNNLDSKIITPALGYIQEIINDNNLSENDKNTYISIMIQMALGNKPFFRIDTNTPYKDAFVEIGNLAGTKANIDKNGNVNYLQEAINDYSKYAKYGSGEWKNSAVEKAEANLAKAKARVEKSFKDKKKSNEELLQEIQKFYRDTKKNPAEEFDWYEDWAKENNITPSDLVANK